jgi:hypothetical protein
MRAKPERFGKGMVQMWCTVVPVVIEFQETLHENRLVDSQLITKRVELFLGHSNYRDSKGGSKETIPMRF